MILIVIALSLLGAPEEPSQNRINLFEKKIRPVLAERCYQCHSAEADRAGMLFGKLQLDTREGVEQGGSRGPAVVPGRPDQSILIEALKHTDRSLAMPPGGKLSDSVLADFVQWVTLGAPYPRDAQAAEPEKMDLESGRRHWAFHPLRSVDPPQISAASSDEAAWTDSPIDRFLLAKLHEMQFRPAQEADRPTLLRRAYFDLIGLAPAPEEVKAFVRDSSEDPCRELVDRLLANPHYGERWGRHWLDVARFGESKGAHKGDNGSKKGTVTISVPSRCVLPILCDAWSFEDDRSRGINGLVSSLLLEAELGLPVTKDYVVEHRYSEQYAGFDQTPDDGPVFDPHYQIPQKAVINQDPNV